MEETQVEQGSDLENREENGEKIWKIQRKILKRQGKYRRKQFLKIWKIWNKSKLNSEKFGEYRRKL